MDGFAFVIFGGLGALVVAVYLLGRYHPRSGADVLDWKPTRSYETQVELELDDLEQMIEAQNARRRRRGDPEITEDDVRARVAEDLRAQRERRDSYLAEDDVQELVEATNARRRARGEPERTVEQVRAELEREAQATRSADGRPPGSGTPAG